MDYFKSIGYECPELTNPADYFMAMMSIESLEEEVPDTDNQDVLKRSRSTIENKYSEIIMFFHRNYQNSNLKSNCSAR